MQGKGISMGQMIIVLGTYLDAIRVDFSMPRLGLGSDTDQSERGRRILDAAQRARDRVTCWRCKELMNSNIRDRCYKCQQEPLQRIALDLASELPDEWVAPYAGELCGLDEHHMRWLKTHREANRSTRDPLRTVL